MTEKSPTPEEILAISGDFRNAIHRAWTNENAIMDWLGLEQTLVATLKNGYLTDAEKVFYVKEAIDAFTKRGYFGHAPIVRMKGEKDEQR